MSTIEQLWQDLIDKDDRNSPEEHPDMALITFDEFANYLRASLSPAPADSAGEDIPLLRALKRSASDAFDLLNKLEASEARVAALQEEVGRLKGEYKF
jgi:uncharacterized small protein (DUF1192 family)